MNRWSGILSGLATGGFGVMLAVGFMWATSAERVRSYEVGGVQLHGRLANSLGEWRQGLSDTPAEAPLEHQTMLFEFGAKEVRTFWMKDMFFPLDIYWFAGDELLGVERAVPVPSPGAEPATVTSPAPADRVLEVPAGTILDFKNYAEF